MNAARSAGWQFLIYVLLLAPFALAFDWAARVLVWPWPVFTWFIRAFFWLVMALIAFCLFYGVWGLSCGYNPQAWDNYARKNDARTLEQVEKIIKVHNERK